MNSITEYIKELERRVDRLERVGGGFDDVWHDLTLLNGWSGYSDTIWGTPQYRKLASGLVIVRGLISGGTTSSGTNMAQLPVGYRPKRRYIFVQREANDGFYGLRVMEDGYLRIGDNGIANNSWVSIACSFYAEQ